MSPPPTPSMLADQLRDVRNDITDISLRLAREHEVVHALGKDFTTLRANPVNIATISFTVTQLIWIVLTVLSLAGAFYSVTEREADTAAAQERLQKNVDQLRLQLDVLHATVAAQGKTP